MSHSVLLFFVCVLLARSPCDPTTLLTCCVRIGPPPPPLKCLEERKRILGPRHDHTLSTQHNLALALAKAGHLTEAVEQARAVWLARCQVLGVDHVTTLQSQHNLATFLDWDGQHHEAVTIGEECLGLRTGKLGEEHPVVLTTLHYLCQALVHDNQLQRAADLQHQCWQRWCRVEGDSHPYTLVAAHALGVMLVKLGDFDRAIPLLQDCMTKRLEQVQRKTKNSTVASVLESRVALLHALLLAGDYAGMVTLADRVRKGDGTSQLRLGVEDARLVLLAYMLHTAGNTAAFESETGVHCAEVVLAASEPPLNSSTTGAVEEDRAFRALACKALGRRQEWMEWLDKCDREWQGTSGGKVWSVASAPW